MTNTAGTLNLYTSLTIGPTLTNAGHIMMHGNGDTLTAGTLNNSGLLFLVGGTNNQTVSVVGGAGNLTNTGNLDLLGNNGTVSVAQTFTNNGALIMYGPFSGVSGNTVTMANWGNLDNSGNLTGGGLYQIGGVFKYTSNPGINAILNIGSGVNLQLLPGGLITPMGLLPRWWAWPAMPGRWRC